MAQALLPGRLTAQAHAGEPLRSPEQAAERLLAVQGQEPRPRRRPRPRSLERRWRPTPRVLEFLEPAPS
ncbi:MAG: hypothetical protein ACJ76D_05385 [Solirubrobacterales bacterium]